MSISLNKQPVNDNSNNNGNSESRKYYIPPVVLVDILDKVRELYGTDAVLVGGRARNVITGGRTRDSEDVDVVVKIDPSRLTVQGVRAMEQEAYKLGFTHFGGDGTRLLYDNSMLTFTVKIDVHFNPGEDSSGIYEDSIKATGRLSGIPIKKILRRAGIVPIYADDVQVPAMVAAPWQLIIMKYNVLRNDREEAELYHREDLVKLIEQQYGSVNAFVAKERGRLESYIAQRIMGKGASYHPYVGDVSDLHQFAADLREMWNEEKLLRK